MNENLIAFFRNKRELFVFPRDIDIERFLLENVEDLAAVPVPAKIFLLDEVEPRGYGFPVTKSSALDELETRLGRWVDDEIAARTAGNGAKKKSEDTLKSYRSMTIRMAQNALHSSILADYHSVFWLVHSLHLSRVFGGFARRVQNVAPHLPREQADVMKYMIFTKWAQAIREALPEIASQGTLAARDEKRLGFVRTLIDNPLIATEEFISQEVRELRPYFSGYVRRDFNAFKKWIDDVRADATRLVTSNQLFRRSMVLLGYPEDRVPFLALLDRRVQQLVADSGGTAATDRVFIEGISRRLVEYFIVYHLRRAVTWMYTTEEGENLGEDQSKEIVYSRAIRPMDFGRRGIVEPIVYRFGLVYDITAFTQTLGEIARGGKQDEQSSYRQMLDFQRELAQITERHAMQFEKFLGDGAFYTSRRATRTINAAIEIQQFYSTMRQRGFAFNKGMRIALNYGYYRLLPMQVSTGGAEIKEFYGPGIVELSRLTSGKATKEIEDIQHLLLTHGYDQMEVLRFFAPLAREVDTTEESLQQREFFAYINANGHLVNEGIVVSIPFLRELSGELTNDAQRLYRLRTKWGNYIGITSATESASYIGARILGSVALKGIGSSEIGEVVRLTHDEAEISIIEHELPLIDLLYQERNRSAARIANATDSSNDDVGVADLVVCESHMQSDGPPVILVGAWDPVAEEVRRPIQLGGDDAERYGLTVPLTAQVVESQSRAYQKIYQTLSRIETLPSFPVQAIRQNTNFSGFIIGATVERL